MVYPQMISAQLSNLLRARSRTHLIAPQAHSRSDLPCLSSQITVVLAIVIQIHMLELAR